MWYLNVSEDHLEPPEDRRRVAFHCEICEEPVYEGEDYFDIPGVGKCCETCISDAKCYDAECD